MEFHNSILKMTKLTNTQLDEITKKQEVKLTAYLLKQIKRSKFIAKQFLPDNKELQPDLLMTEPFKGLLSSKINGFERLYEDRVLFKLTSFCPAHCRFCYRKLYLSSGEKIMNKKDIKKGLEYVKKNKSIRSVLLTGGTALYLGTTYIEKIIKELVKIKHINQIYFALGRPIMDPALITNDFANMLVKYQKMNILNPKYSKNIGCTVHINHPDELTPEVLLALNKLTSKGINVWVQTVLLKGINDSKKTIKELYSLFSANNILPYYLIHAMPLTGAGHFRTSISKGQELIRYLERYSGHERPKFIVVPSIGKIQLTGNSDLKYKFKNKQRYVSLKSAYLAKEFLKINKLKSLPPNCSVSNDGYIVYDYLDGID